MGDDKEGMWGVGVVLVVFACVLNVFGVHLQKYSHLVNAKLPVSQQKPYYNQFLWWNGLILIVLGTLADVVALAFAAQSLIAPLAALTLVFNIMLNPYFLKETVTVDDVKATLVIVVGCCIAVGFADHYETAYNFKDLVNMTAYNPIFITYFTLVVLSMVLCFVLHNRFVAESFDETNWYAQYKEWHPAVIATLAGLAGSLSVTFSKGMMELLKALEAYPSVAFRACVSCIPIPRPSLRFVNSL